MDLKQLALEALDKKEAEAKEAVLIQAQSTGNFARAKFKAVFGVEPEKIEAVAGFAGNIVDVWCQGIHLRYGLFGVKGRFHMVAPCPECGEEVVGHAPIADLIALGKELKDFEPHNTHICPAVVVRADAAFEPVPTWQDLLDALNRIGAELTRANDRLDSIDERSDVGK